MATLKSIKNKYLDAADGAVLGVDTNTENISALSFKLATADSLSKFNLVDGFADDYQDATGVDAGGSTNDDRDASGKYYKGVAVTTPTATGGTITTSGDYKIHTFNNYFIPGTEEIHEDAGQKKFGVSSLYLDGSDYLTSNAQANYNLSGDFTIEMWVRLESVNDTIISSLSNTNWSSASTNDWILLIDGAGYIGFNVKNVGTVYGSSDVRNLNTWQHVAVVRNSGTTTIYIDGTSYVSNTGAGSGAIGNSANTIEFGRGATTLTGSYQGWVDEFRMSNTARWTANFTPAAAAYTSDQYTLCLMHFDYNNQDNNRNFTVDCQYTNSHAQDVEMLMVAGGGGGGGMNGGHYASAGGGGGGGMLEGSSITMNAGTYGMTIGGAGAGGDHEGMPTPNRGRMGMDAGDSVITNATWGTATAIGGGGGGTASSGAGRTGGSGGGGGGYWHSSPAGGSASQGNSNGLTGYGFAGGAGGNRSGSTNAWAAGAGGGGAGGAAGNGSTSTRGANGPGRANAISGAVVTYAAGGESQNSGGASSGTDATAATGNGGGGGRVNGDPVSGHFGGRGGSGILIIKRPTSASEPGNMTLVSNAYTAQTAPTTTRIVLDSLTAAGGTTLNTDLKAYVSRDNGTTYTQITLADQGYLNPNSGIDGYTKLMLHCDGSNNGTTFTDSSFSAHTVTASGNAVTDTTYKKFGTAGYKCPATGDFLSISDSEDWNFGSGDFTIDAWLYRTGTSSYQTILENKTDNSNYWQWRYFGSGGNITFSVTGSGSFTVSFGCDDSTFPVNTWVHHQMVRSGNSWKLFQNGTQTGTTQTQAAAIPDMTGNLILQGDSSLGQPFVGYMDEFRISKGIARNTSNFVVPSGEYVQSRRLLSGSVDISGQPSGTNVKYKIETLNQSASKQTRVYGTSMAWA